MRKKNLNWIGGAVAAASFLALCAASAQTADPGAAVAAYDRANMTPANIAPTIATASHEGVAVFGQPRMAVGHPNTLWDKEDIAHYKEMLKTSPELRQKLEEMRSQTEQLVSSHAEIPPPQKNEDGTWRFPGEYFPQVPGKSTDDARARFRMNYERDANLISNLGILYALTDDEKFAESAHDLLLAYAHASQYGFTDAVDYRFAQGLSDQLLVEALTVAKTRLRLRPHLQLQLLDGGRPKTYP